MLKNIKYVIVTGFILYANLAIGQDDSLITPILGNYIVKAKVVDNKPNSRGYLEAKLAIQHVYLGPSELNGQYFVINTNDRGAYGDPSVLHSLKIDSEGLWIVVMEEETISPRTYYAMGILSPTLKNRDGIRYEKALKLAEVIEKTSKIEGFENQVTRVKELILDDSPDISTWAVEALSESYRASDQQHLYDLAGKGQLTVPASIKLDEILLEKHGDSWAKSEDRKKFMAEILKRENITDDEAKKIIRHLFSMIPHDPINTSDFIYLLEVAQANKNLLNKTAEDIIYRVIRKMMNSDKDPEKIFTTLLQDMKSEEKTRSESARKLLLSFSTGLDEKQVEVLRQIRNETDDKDTSGMLDKILSIYVETIPE